MKKFLPVIFLSFVTCNIFAQSTFIKYLDCGTSTCNAKEAIITKEGEIAILRVFIGDSKNKMHLTKFTQDGTFLSDWLFEDTEGNELIFHKVTGTADGGFIFTGHFHPKGPFGDACLAKVDAAGNLQWIRRFEGDSDTPQEYGRAVFQTANGEYLMFQSMLNTTFLMRLDAGGNILWSKKMNNLYLNDAIQLVDGSLVTAMTNIADSLKYKLRAIKFDENGNVIWARQLKSMNYLEGHKVIQLTDKSLVFDAISITSLGDTTMPLIRLDSSGNLLWAKTFLPFPLSTKVTELHITAENNGNIGVGVAAYSQNASFLKLNSQGNILASKKFALQYFKMADIEKTPDNGFFLCGKVRSGNNSSPQAYLLKTNADGIIGCNTKSVAFVSKSYTDITSQPFTLNPYIAINISSFTNLTVTVANEDYTTHCFFNYRNAFDSITDFDSSTIAFPNPFESSVTITLPDDKNYTVYISDQEGRVLQVHNNILEQFIAGKNLLPGFYFAQLISEDGSQQNIKIVKSE
ncbi:MAG: T9SS type A sorting domain-containing protein [Chitinophagales bacterium]